MGFLGSNRGLTPNLDALAQHSAVFTRAYSQVPLTTASHATILTGTYPQYHHVNEFGFALRAALPFLPDLLKQNGYRTAASVGSLVLDPVAGTAPGFERGFDFYDAGYRLIQPGESRYGATERRAEDVIAHALTWLKKRPKEKPFFLWVHLYDPHVPYESPEPYRTRFSDPYDAEIAYSDAMVGQLFAALQENGIYDGSVITVMADHGEAFGEHGESLHGIFLYDETIHVPLLIKLPATPNSSVRAMQKIDSRVALADVLPTLLDSVGIPIPTTVQGRSLMGLIRPKTAAPPPAERPVYSESDYPHFAFKWSSLRSLRTGNYLYVAAPKRELYRVNTDPQAKHNLAASSSAIADTLSAQLDAFRKSTESDSAASFKPDPQLAAKLSSLGYVAGNAEGGARGEVGGVDPKDRIEIANSLHHGLLDAEQGDVESATRELERVIQAEPATAMAYEGLGDTLIRQRNYEKALPILRKAVELRPGNSRAQYQMGLALFQTGNLKGSATHFEEAIKLVPGWIDAHYSLATVYVRDNRGEDAIRELDKTLELAPNLYRANLLRGILLVLNGRPAEGLANLQRAAADQPAAIEPHAYLAQAYERLGDTAKASEERNQVERLGGGR